jgi:hypothetical protein
VVLFSAVEAVSERAAAGAHAPEARQPVPPALRGCISGSRLMDRSGLQHAPGRRSQRCAHPTSWSIGGSLS